MTQTHRLELKQKDIGQRGIRYSVSYEGQQIVEASVSPLGDACRVLASRGLYGRVEMWGSEPYPRLIADVLRAAGQTVSEGQRTGLRVVPWTPYSVALGSGEDGNEGDAQPNP